MIADRTAPNQSLYAVTLIDISAAGGTTNALEQEVNAGLGTVSDLGFLSFAFNVNPKSMNLEEPAATTIVPTQNKGQYIERQGQIYKNINITGTTGLRPNRDMRGAVIPIAGVINPFFGQSIDPQTGLPQGETTGFDDLIALRNLHRRYWDLMDDPQNAPNILMVWQNGKEGEYYIVEPMKFETARDASSPLTMTYTIQYRTIERLDITKLAGADSYIKRNGVDTFFQRMSNIRRQLAVGYQIATSYIDRAISMGQAAVTNVLSPVNDVLNALTGIVNSGSRVFNIPKNNLAVVAGNALDLSTALDKAADAYQNYGIVDPIETAAWSYRLMARQLHALGADPGLFSSPLSSTMTAKASAYTDPTTGAPITGGSPTYIGNQRATNGASVATVNTNENIYGVAQRLLGDSAKWKVLVVLNRLKAPYISPAGDGVNVLRPGQQILFPTQMAQTASAVQPNDPKYSNISPLNERLGRDLKLRAIEGAGGVTLYDVVISSSGDLETISGIDNMEQAILIKFETEQGELPTHPRFGIRYPIGSKARVQSAIGFQVNARATLLADSRIGSVDQFSVSGSGNVLNVKTSLTLKGADQALSLDFSVER